MKFILMGNITGNTILGRRLKCGNWIIELKNKDYCIVTYKSIKENFEILGEL